MKLPKGMNSLFLSSGVLPGISEILFLSEICSKIIEMDELNNCEKNEIDPIEICFSNN